MKWFRRATLLASSLGVVASLGCRGEKPASRPDSASSAVPPTVDSAAARATSNWDPGAGYVLLVGTDTPTHALVIPPANDDTTALAAIPHPASATLLGRGGDVQIAELPTVIDTAGCHVGSLTAAPPPHSWSVGFIGAVVAPIAVDSSSSIPQTDSATLVASLNRLASAMPNDSAGRFAGLPFVVQTMWRFTLSDGPTVLVGSLVRQLNQEATPLQERTFLVAERRPGDTTFTAEYSERSYGQEETIETRELLSAILVGDARTPAIVLSRDFGSENAYSLLERGSDGHWMVRWTSRRRKCGQ